MAAAPPGTMSDFQRREKQRDKELCQVNLLFLFIGKAKAFPESISSHLPVPSPTLQLGHMATPIPITDKENEINTTGLNSHNSSSEAAEWTYVPWDKGIATLSQQIDVS